MGEEAIMSIRIAPPAFIEVECTTALKQMLAEFKREHRVMPQYDYRTLVKVEGNEGEWIQDDYHGPSVVRQATPVEVEWMQAYYVLLTFFKCMESKV
jgi:hypothetical protein